jgi:hypothetical protein
MLMDSKKNQFSVTTKLNDEIIRIQPITDPFIHSRINIEVGWKDILKGLFGKLIFEVSVIIDATPWIKSSIMQLDPEELEKVWEENNRDREKYYYPVDLKRIS